MRELKTRPPRVYFEGEKVYIISNGKRKYLKFDKKYTKAQIRKIVARQFRKKNKKKKKKKKTKKRTKKRIARSYPVLQSTGSSSQSIDKKIDKAIEDIKKNFDYSKFVGSVVHSDPGISNNIRNLELKFENLQEEYKRMNAPPEIKLEEPRYYDTEEKEEKDFKGLRQIMRGVYVAPSGLRAVRDVMDTIEDKKRIEQENKIAERELVRSNMELVRLGAFNEALQEVGTELVNENKQLTESVGNLRYINVNLEDQVRNTREYLEILQAENKNLNEEIDIGEQISREMQIFNDDLKRANVSLIGRNAVLEETKALGEATVDRLNTENKVLGNINFGLKNDVKRLDETIENMNSTILTKEKEKEKLLEDLIKMQFYLTKETERVNKMKIDEMDKEYKIEQIVQREKLEDFPLKDMKKIAEAAGIPDFKIVSKGIKKSFLFPLPKSFIDVIFKAEDEYKGNAETLIEERYAAIIKEKSKTEAELQDLEALVFQFDARNVIFEKTLNAYEDEIEILEKNIEEEKDPKEQKKIAEELIEIKKKYVATKRKADGNNENKDYSVEKMGNLESQIDTFREEITALLEEQQRLQDTKESDPGKYTDFVINKAREIEEKNKEEEKEKNDNYEEELRLFIETNKYNKPGVGIEEEKGPDLDQYRKDALKALTEANPTEDLGRINDAIEKKVAEIQDRFESLKNAFKQGQEELKAPELGEQSIEYLNKMLKFPKAKPLELKIFTLKEGKEEKEGKGEEKKIEISEDDGPPIPPEMEEETFETLKAGKAYAAMSKLASEKEKADIDIQISEKKANIWLDVYDQLYHDVYGVYPVSIPMDLPPDTEEFKQKEIARIGEAKYNEQRAERAREYTYKDVIERKIKGDDPIEAKSDNFKLKHEMRMELLRLNELAFDKKMEAEEKKIFDEKEPEKKEIKTYAPLKTSEMPKFATMEEELAYKKERKDRGLDKKMTEIKAAPKKTMTHAEALAAAAEERKNRADKGIVAKVPEKRVIEDTKAQILKDVTVQAKKFKVSDALKTTKTDDDIKAVIKLKKSEEKPLSIVDSKKISDSMKNLRASKIRNLKNKVATEMDAKQLELLSEGLKDEIGDNKFKDAADVINFFTTKEIKSREKAINDVLEAQKELDKVGKSAVSLDKYQRTLAKINDNIFSTQLSEKVFDKEIDGIVAKVSGIDKLAGVGTDLNSTLKKIRDLVQSEGEAYTENKAAEMGVAAIEPKPDKEEEKKTEQRGEGGKKFGGLYNDQIEKIMDRYPRFEGVYAADEITDLPNKKKMGFVMNLDKSNKKGSHWVAVYIDTDKDRSVEYYDSYGDEPSKDFMKKIKEVIDRIDPDTYLKFKVNKIKQQSSNSNNCGIFAIKFLMDRFQGKKFVDCTGYSDVKNGEKMAEELKHKFEKFGYI